MTISKKFRDQVVKRDIIWTAEPILGDILCSPFWSVIEKETLNLTEIGEVLGFSKGENISTVCVRSASGEVSLIDLDWRDFKPASDDLWETPFVVRRISSE